MSVHRGVTYLLHYGESERERSGDHQFHLRIEESSGEFMMAGAEGEFEMPWLRACCSCGWASDVRFTIDENARDDWHRHVDAGRPYHCGGSQTGQPRPHRACTCTPREEAAP